MYKVAIRCNEIALAAECLRVISSLSIKDTTLLYACVLDAQQVGNRSQAVAALQLVLDKDPDTSGNVVHLPSLLRVTIKLTSSLLDNSEDAEAAVNLDSVEKLCRLFESGKWLLLL